ncbi:MAG: LytTR family DNA-binding domain-containing protein, partial [Bacteroidota bacterium]
KYKRLLSNLQTKANPPFYMNPTGNQSYQKRFLTRFREKTIVKRIEETALFSVENETVYLYTFEGKRYPLFKKLEYIESVCDPNQFFRINRQMLVNLQAIVSFEPYFSRKIILELSITTEQPPIVSRMKVTSFKEWLEK